jgi:Lar family restriction alleviation protein
MSEAKLLVARELRERGHEVKPCPFCGEQEDIQHHDDGQTWPRIECCYCGCSMQEDEEYSALYYWNQRASEGGWVRRTTGDGEL